MDRKSQQHACDICKKSFPDRDLYLGGTIRGSIFSEIVKDHSDFTAESRICSQDLASYRAGYVNSLLESEKGEISNLEREVVTSIEKHDLLVKNVEEELDQKWTLGERMADGLASFGGSWTFLGFFSLFLLAWIAANSYLILKRPWDPYPFILLNLILSCLAAVQAPIIMMSQNRQEAKDRLRSQHDYQVNLKAELEIRILHEKVDHLLSRQWERLAKIQEIQMDLLAELAKRR